MEQKPTREPVGIESNNGLKNTIGSIAMARTQNPNSATAQFFINVADNVFLNYTEPTVRGYGYTVFGTVVKGMDVVEKIASSPTGPGGPFPKDVPQQQVVIEDIVLLEGK
jgi:peptidyl-prolyl cis-trans isomerase A (cyclophilin A)/peptidyl-prolyl cis-trans isomerase B (cyclophilin B)